MRNRRPTSWIATLVVVTLVTSLPSFAITRNLAQIAPVVAAATKAAPIAPSAATLDPKVEEFVDQQIQRLTLKQKIGQLFIFGFMGDTTDRGLSETLQKNQPGGVIVFGRNITGARQLAKLNFASQKLAIAQTGLPLFIAVDQEGGDVIRIKTSPPLPSALALGQTKSGVLAQAAGYHTGILLKTLGFTMNLAPVVDVSDPAKDSFIGTRTFGKDPQNVAYMGGEFALGLTRAGILPTAKHFPGHGGINEDSHQMLVEKSESLEEMLKMDLLPFAEMAKGATPPAMMVAHVAFPKLDRTGLPATFSKTIVTDLLRHRLGFQGIVITDDIEMAGAAGIADIGERALAAIQAGADLVMLGWNKKLQSQAIASVFEAARTGRLTETRIDESLRRLMRAKYRILATYPKQFPSDGTLLSALHNEALKKVSAATLEQRFKAALADVDHDFLQSASEKPVIVFSPTNSFYQSFHANAHQPTRFVHIDEQTQDVNHLLRANPNAMGVFYVSGPHAARLANLIAPDVAARMLLVNSETPSLLRSPDSFRQMVNVYFHHPDLGKMTALYFFNGKPPSSAPVATDGSIEGELRGLASEHPTKAASTANSFKDAP